MIPDIITIVSFLALLALPLVPFFIKHESIAGKEHRRKMEDKNNLAEAEQADTQTSSDGINRTQASQDPVEESESKNIIQFSSPFQLQSFIKSRVAYLLSTDQANKDAEELLNKIYLMSQRETVEMGRVSHLINQINRISAREADSNSNSIGGYSTDLARGRDFLHVHPFSGKIPIVSLRTVNRDGSYLSTNFILSPTRIDFLSEDAQKLKDIEMKVDSLSQKLRTYKSKRHEPDPSIVSSVEERIQEGKESFQSIVHFLVEEADSEEQLEHMEEGLSLYHEALETSF